MFNHLMLIMLHYLYQLPIVTRMLLLFFCNKLGSIYISFLYSCSILDNYKHAHASPTHAFSSLYSQLAIVLVVHATTVKTTQFSYFDLKLHIQEWQSGHINAMHYGNHTPAEPSAYNLVCITVRQAYCHLASCVHVVSQMTFGMACTVCATQLIHGIFLSIIQLYSYSYVCGYMHAYQLATALNCYEY